ncbi:putative arsenate reductase [Sphingobacterium spiritivorum ATCC 33300]|uniref:Putative arsenate reductase n=1 Tax=Sphingobacterium spiritivorum ATCC 33300 TaxID=525372 RepID=C2G3N8_SPHSI|nr:ArsC/Spx/MgsR family protein [Sphingobacterium spiritivorum]EEI90243.1 putative arsenate reductase [Sphingobacterium spiritivorum ATCC 33300]QQS95126.1 arsenate reductase (glutaredoxin) [Sphingobacterium spiritivorum]
MIKIYHNNVCSKSRAALDLLKAYTTELDVQEYITDTPDKEELTLLLDMLQLKPIELIRRNETVFEEKFKDVLYTDDEWIDIMLQYPVLIERPIVVRNGKAVIGRPIERVIDLLRDGGERDLT